jgi:hypothetical protein
VNTSFYQPIQAPFFNPTRVVLLAAVLLLLAWRAKQRRLLFGWFFLWIAPLPITFIPGRGGACLYVPLAGWAVIIASVFVSLSTAAARSALLRWMPARAAVGALVGIGIAMFWINAERRGGSVPTGVLKPAALTWSVADQIRALQPTVRPGSRIYVAHDPFRTFDMKFIMELVYHDRSVNVWLGEQVPLPPAEINRMDYVFTFEDGRLKRLKGP